MFSDFVYFSTLIFCIILGCYYKQIDNIDVKRHYGMGVGFIIAMLICGHYIYHTILMVWLNTMILKCCDRRYVHKMSLMYTWLHLLYLHIHLVDLPYVILIHQTIALRLVGMAFEMYGADTQLVNPTSSGRINSGDIESVLEPTTVEIVSYAFFFIGLHKGPYYRFEIFCDHLKGSFGNLGDFREITKDKLKSLLLCLIGYLFLRLKYSPQIYYDKAFYDYDADTRYLYNIPLLVMFFCQREITMLLSFCVCTEAGFGMYPAKMMPLPGHGPSTRYSLLHMTQEEALQHEYNFHMIKCYNNQKLLLGPRMKDTMNGWDMPIRYWFWANIHKNIFRSQKEIRSACSFLAWTLWRGPSLQHIILSCTLWVYIHMEAEYGILYNTSGHMKLPWDIGFSIMRILCLIYLTPCFIVDDAAAILKYYNSIFWVFHVVLLVLLVGAIVTYKSRKGGVVSIVE